MEREILVVTESLPPVYGGADIAAYRYFKFLKEGHKRVWLLGNWNSNAVREENLVMIRSLKTPRALKRYGVYYLHFVVLFTQSFFFLLRHPQIKVVHAFNSITLIVQVSVLAAKLLGRKVLLETSLKGSDDPVTILSRKGGRMHQWASGKVLRRKLYRLANGYIAKSSYLKGLFDSSELAHKPVVIIPYFVNTHLYNRPSPEEKQVLRRQLNLPPDKLIICFVGGINIRKGVGVLVQAFENCLRGNKNIYLLLVGPTEKYDQEYVQLIRNQLNTIGLAHSFMAGHVTDTSEWMKASDIYVLPSLREGFPISILEALCCGLTVIASDIPEIRNVQIQHGHNGFLFTPGSVEGLTEYLETVLNMSAVLPIATVQQEALQRYSVLTVADQYHTFYNSLAHFA